MYGFQTKKCVRSVRKGDGDYVLVLLYILIKVGIGSVSALVLPCHHIIFVLSGRLSDGSCSVEGYAVAWNGLLCIRFKMPRCSVSCDDMHCLSYILQ